MPAARGTEQQDLIHHLGVVRHRKWTIAFAMLTVVGVALGASFLQEPKYGATAHLLLRPSPSEAPAVDQDSRAITRSIPTEIELIQAAPIRERVAKRLGAAPPVRVAQVKQTEFISIRAEHNDPEASAAIANAYATEYIEYRREQTVDALFALSERVQAEVRTAEAQATQLDAQVGGREPSVEQRQARDELAVEISEKKGLLREFQRDAEATAGAAQLVTRATPAGDPFAPNHVRTALLSIVVGACFGLAVAFGVDFLDDTVKVIDEVERATGGLPVLGLIPAVPGWKDRTRPMLVARDDPTGLAAEAYRTVRTSVQFLALERPLRTLQVTSPAAREGKTTTLANLAVTLANAGQRVAVVCCDLRKPRVHEFFGLTNEIGFTSVLLGEVPLSGALQPVPRVPGLFLLASGPPPPNPSELVASARTVEVLTALQATHDIVLIDCPPVLPVTDAASLSHRVDATLIVATAGTTAKKALTRATELLKQVEAPLIGGVLNGVSDGEGYGYGYGYGQGAYGGRAAPPVELQKPRKRRKAQHVQSKVPATRSSG